MAEYETQVTCPHCHKEFETTVEIEPDMDWNDLD